MTGLFVSVQDDAVHLVRGEGVPDSLWSSARQWWEPVALRMSESDISISLVDFDARKSWLRLSWPSLEHKVALDPEVHQALKRVADQLSEFELRLAAVEPNIEDAHQYLNSVSHKRAPTLNQALNVLSLAQMKNGANFSVPGAGKTSTQYMVWEKLKNEGLVQQVLVICPKSSFEAWESEPRVVFDYPVSVGVYQVGHIPRGLDVLVVNYEQIERPRQLRELQKWVQEANTLLVIDEAHRIKGGATSVRWRAARSLSAYSSRTDILTGTPMPQGLDDIRNLLSVAWRDLPKGYLTDKKLKSLKPWTVFVRTTKAQLGLPPVKIELIPITMGPIQSQIYSALGKNYAGTLSLNRYDQATLAQKGRAIFTLLAAATNPGLIVKYTSEDAYLGLQWPPSEIHLDAELTSVLTNYARHELPAKYEWLVKFVEASVRENRKVLIWSTFVGNLNAVAKLLQMYNPAVVHGAVQGDERRNQISKFRNNKSCHVLISNPQTLGEGVSLHHECHDAVFLDRSFNAGQYLQALDRIHRLGLPSDQETRVFLLSSKGTIDDRVDVRLARKIAALADLLDDEGLVEASLPDDEIESALEVLGIDDADLDAILRHLKEFK